jgi:TM2 domain-containing membrane protein YozV
MALTEETVRMAMGTVFCEEHVPRTEPPAAPAASPYAGRDIPNPGVSPGLAFLLGMIPGVGAIYNAQYAKGLVHVLILGLLISIASSGSAGGLEPLFGLVTGVFWFYMAFEAYHTARKRVLGEPVDEFSSLIQLNPGSGRYPVLPPVLIALGVLFLLNNFELLRMRDVLRFWPVLLIVAGAWMLFERLRPASGNPPGPDAPSGEVKL